MLKTSKICDIELKIMEILLKQDNIVIAIDGMCGSGKTTLAKKLKSKYSANLIRSDDFYLPKQLRSEERLEEEGGNIDYERLRVEIIDHLKEAHFQYRKYNCQTDEFSSFIEIEEKRIIITEGSYSLNPHIGKYYDLAIFVETSDDEQYDRILKREGNVRFKNFVNKWISLENKYFKELDIENKADIVYSTSSLH